MCCSVDELAMVHKGSSNAVHNNAERIVVPGAGGEVQVFHVMQGRIPTELLAALSAPLSDEDCTALYHEVGLHRALPVPKTERPKVLWLFGPPAAGKSTLAAEHSPTIFGINGSAVSVDGEEIRGQHKGFRRVAQHGLENHLLHKDAWGILKATGHVEGLKRTILRKAIQNRQNITMPDCALKPARVMEMLKEFQDADYEMHAICLWAPAHEAERRGRLRSVQTGKAYSPKFHRPSSDGTIEIARYWEEQMRQGNKHFNGIKYYDATSLPACPVVLNEVENLMENSELVRRVSLGRDDARRLSFKKPGLHAAEAAILHKGPSQTWKDYVLQICWLAPGFWLNLAEGQGPRFCFAWLGQDSSATWVRVSLQRPGSSLECIKASLFTTLVFLA
ncbi:unnamed protein product [Effrenium voratum]|nr:unnamed protein product [Effrenium voratum]